MMNFRFLAGIVGMALVGCSALSPQRAGIDVSGLVFYNESGNELRRVQIKVVPTGGLVGCGYLPVDGLCSTTFPGRRYHDAPLIVSWQEVVDGNRPFDSKEVVVALPEERDPQISYEAVVRLGTAGSYEISFRKAADKSE